MITRKKIIAGNWKMNKTQAEARVLVERADAALYPAKRAGRRRFAHAGVEETAANIA